MSEGLRATSSKGKEGVDVNNLINVDASKVPKPTSEFGRRLHAQLFGESTVTRVSESVASLHEPTLDVQPSGGQETRTGNDTRKATDTSPSCKLVMHLQLKIQGQFRMLLSSMLPTANPKVNFRVLESSVPDEADVDS